jgi:hypothetical protein
MTFEEWFNEIEGYATRGERFEDWMFSTGDAGKGKDWLLAAYNAGFKEGSKQPVPLTVTTVPHIKYPTPSNPTPMYPPPFIPRPMPTTPPTQPAWPSVISCSKCGISLGGVMGYVCCDQSCPTFMNVWSGTITGSITAGDTGPYFNGSSNLSKEKKCL